MWDWLIHTDAGLLARIGIGAAIFVVLAVVDLRKNRRNATRWREYVFLLTCIGAALLYGAVNDQLTCSISWEYFFYGKGLADVLPAGSAAAGLAFRWEVAKIGMKAAWSAGLVIGVAMLIANNPSARRRTLPIPRLMRLIVVPFLVAAACAVLFGVAGYLGAFTRYSHDFADMVRGNEMRPYRFMSVFGVHLGGYVGGLLGTVLAVIHIRLRRRIEVTSSFQIARNV